jgi:DNA invertase Pin-like site-specific DNA recombinase
VEVVFWTLDRLSKEVPLAILSLVNRLKIYGVRDHLLRRAGPRHLVRLESSCMPFSGWVARMESQRRSERAKAGLARVVAQGKHLGRPPGSKDKKKGREGFFSVNIPRLLYFSDRSVANHKVFITLCLQSVSFSLMIY